MSSAPTYLGLEQSDELYRDQKLNYEYWFGEAVQKSTPTTLHRKLQLIIGMLRLAWDASVEMGLKLSRQARPVPDVVGDHAALGEPYPIERFDLCAEVLSPGDRL